MLTRSKRIHEVRNQGATPFALFALLLFALPLLFTLQKLFVLPLLGDIEYNRYLPYFPFYIIVRILNYPFDLARFLASCFASSRFKTFLPLLNQLEYLLSI